MTRVIRNRLDNIDSSGIGIPALASGRVKQAGGTVAVVTAQAGCWICSAGVT